MSTSEVEEVENEEKRNEHRLTFAGISQSAVEHLTFGPTSTAVLCGVGVGKTIETA